MSPQLRKVINTVLYSPEFYSWSWTELSDAYHDSETNNACRAVLSEEMELRRCWAD